MKHLKSICCFLIVIVFFAGIANNCFAISIPEEKKLAEKFMQQVKEQDMLMKDPIANHLVRQVGNHIVSILPDQPFDYSFYVVDADVFNAFATPGANIFFYRGLITSLDSVDELAGIVGHEIAHAASRHVSESIDRSKYIGMGTLIGVLTGALIGGTSDGETGAAIIKGSMALGHTSMLSFTRENETEADEKGIMFLKKSCFSPQALASGLMKIRESDFRGLEGIPDYVKTHPGTGSRIAHVENILANYKPPKNKPVCKTDFRFDMVKYRLLGMYADIDPTFKLLETRLAQTPSDAAIHYGIGLLYARKFMRKEAIDHLKKALSIQFFDSYILLELGRIYLEDGYPEKALKTLTSLESDPVIGPMALYHQSTANLQLKNFSLAKNGFQTVIYKAPNLYPKVYLNLANILAHEKKTGLSAYNLGLYYSKIKKESAAVVHLNRAIKHLNDENMKKKANTLLTKLKKKISDKKAKDLQNR